MKTYVFSAKSSRRKVKIILNETVHYRPSERLESFTLAMEKHIAHQMRANRAQQKAEVEE